ncbi:MAG: hypothetical protein H0W11_07765 [Gemmatimonadetes bacterium]|nr:hypothetical protein [Gemmatimonadota bacterium]
MRKGLTAALLMLVPGCTIVDQTEHCVLTRYGRVIEQQMSQGLNWTPFSSATCFSMTEQNFPQDPGRDSETMEAQTRDPVTVTGDVSVVFAYDPATIYEVFLEKRSATAVEVEIRNAIREGYRNALAGWTVTEIFSPRRANLADSVQTHIQAKLGNRARIERVFVRDIRIPQVIEQARIEAARQEQVLAQARQQLVIDSVNAEAVVMRERGSAEARRLRAQSYAANPALIQLEQTEAWSRGVAEACRQAQTCVLGGSIMDAFSAGGGRPR